jgi:hypothetical protein
MIWASAVCFCATLSLLCYLAVSRVHLESYSLSSSCSIYASLPEQPFGRPPDPPLPPSVRLHTWLVDGEPGSTPVAWAPETHLMPALQALLQELAPALDATLAPPRRLAYGSLVDPALLHPLHTATGSLAYVIPTWAAAALPGLNEDWPVHAGPSEARTAHALEGGGGAPVLASACAPSQLLEEPNPAADVRLLSSTLAAALSSLAGAVFPSTAATLPCAPSNLLQCSGRLHCATHRGGQSLHLLLYHPPAAISPLLYELPPEELAQARGWLPLVQHLCTAANATGCTVAASPLRYLPPLGWVYALPAGSAEERAEEVAAAAAAAFAATLNATQMQWTASHYSASAQVLGHYCREFHGGRAGEWGWLHWLLGGMQGMQRRVPAHVAALLSAAAQGMAQAVGRGSSRESQQLARQAHRHASAAAQDAQATLDGHVAPQHTLAVYLPWWAPVAAPLLMAVCAPGLQRCRGGKGKGGGAQ